jgi:invasion protein IalB
MIRAVLVPTLLCGSLLSSNTPLTSATKAIGPWAVACEGGINRVCVLNRAVADPASPRVTRTFIGIGRLGPDVYFAILTNKVSHSVITLVADGTVIEKLVTHGCLNDSCSFGGLIDSDLAERLFQTRSLVIEAEFAARPRARIPIDLTGLRTAVYALP